MSTVSELGTIGEAMEYLTGRGLAAGEACEILTRVFGWGVDAAKFRQPGNLQPPPSPPRITVSPATAEQLPLIEGDMAKPAKITVAKEAKPKQVARTWPDDFKLTDALIKFATDRGFNHQDIQRMWEKFRDRNMARGEKYTNWDAAWRMWVGNAVEFRNRDSRQNADRNRIDDRL